MGSRLLPQAIWILVTMLAFTIGYLSHDSPAGKAEGPMSISTAAIPLTVAGKDGPTADVSPEARAKPAVSPILTLEQARVRMFEILSEGRIDRLRHTLDLLPSITRENWQGVLDAFARQARSGRTYSQGADFHLVLERIGAIAGAEAINGRLDKPDENSREIAQYIVQGWAEKDPRSALEWFQQLPPESRGGVIKDLTVGVARADPSAALEVASLEKSVLPMAKDADNIIMEMVQQKGIGATDDMLAAMQGRTDIPADFQGKIFGSTADRRIQICAESGNLLGGLDWFEQYLGQDFVGPKSTDRLITQAASSNPEKTENWLARNGARMNPAQLDSACASLVRSWQAQSPDQFAQWMTAHSADPQYNQLAVAAARQQLAAGDLEQAQRWSQTVTDPDLRAGLDAAALEAAKRRQPAK